MRILQDPMEALLALLRHHAPELLPGCRCLILGPHFAGPALNDCSRPPTIREVIALKRVVERHGPALCRPLADLLEASGSFPAVRAEIQLDRLLELDPSLWIHPAQVLDHPISDTADLLEACRLRIEVAADEEKDRLQVVEEELARVAQIQDKARDRRRKRAKRGGM